MSQLNQNTLPCERMRGAKWADTFKSAAEVALNEGVVVGAPTFDIINGVTLDGTNDYLTFNLTGNEFNSANISIVADFTPDFNWDEDATRRIFDTTLASPYKITKANNAGSNVLAIYLGVWVAGIPSATYSPFWLQGQRNVIVVSGTTGNIYVWLNGHEIAHVATAWTPKSPTELYIGSESTGSYKFDGTIHSLKVFHSLLTQQEAQDYYDQTTFNYMDNAIVFPMTIGHDTGTAITDASGTYSLDKNGAPVKLSHRGYSLDGASWFDITDAASDGVFDPGVSFSVLLYFIPSTMAIEYLVAKWDGPSNQRGWLIARNAALVTFYISPDGTASETVSKASALIQNIPSCIVATYNVSGGAGSMIGNIYVDELTAATRVNFTGPAYNSTANFCIASLNGGFPLTGDILYAAYIPGIVMTQLQHFDFMAKMRTQFQRV